MNRFRFSFYAAALGILIVTLAFSISEKALPDNQPYHSCKFSFSLKQTVATSAGVFDKEGHLLRTLWSGITYSAGVHSAVWDGTDDDGRLLPNGSYQVRVLSNNVKYTWEGVLGNTSENFTGPYVHHAHVRIMSVAIAGNKAYYATDFNERGSSSFKFITDKPQSREVILQKGISARLVATDGIHVYWAGNDSFNYKKWIVYASNVADDKETIFANGAATITKQGNKYNSALDTVYSKILGLAVQKHGNFLVVTHKDINEVHVLNKITGAFVKSNAIPGPEAACVDAADNLWLIYNKAGKVVAEKFSIKADGSLAPLNVALNDLVQPLAMAVSPDNQTLLVADAGNSQQVKAFNNQSGTAKWILGQQGGYASSPDVTNNKFYFSDVRGILGTTIAFQPDGSFWVEDSGNSRLQHYAANRNFLNRIMYLGSSYSCSADLNNATRVFSDYLEFKIDYAKPLRPDNGSWTLVKNWGYLIPKNFDDHNRRLQPVVTLHNGRTYALLNNSTKHQSQVVELPQQGNLRITDVALPKGICQLNADGSVTRLGVAKAGQPLQWSKYLLDHFDDQGNPVWDDERPFASVLNRKLLDPIYQPSPINLHVAEVTSSGMVLAFNAARNMNGNDGWHLGGVKSGDTQWLWRTAISTSEGYSGDFPADGTFDNGNGVKYAGSTSLASGRNIFWGYHGEFWKGSQVNKWNHVYDDGLFVGQFGATGPSPNGPVSPWGMAGNAYAATVVKDNEGNLYLYHNDENHHSGVHRWKITNLNSIAEQTLPVQLTGTAQGLSAVYYNCADLDNVTQGATELSSNLNLSWSDKLLADKHIINADVFSIKWEGFIKPKYSEPYSFGNVKNASLRLWIDHKLVIDNWNNQGSATQSMPMLLEAGKQYPIRIEYRHTHGALSTFALTWTSQSQSTQVIPASQLIPAEQSNSALTYDLLEDLPYNQVLEDNRFGWKRSVDKEDYTDKYKQWWTVHTNVKSYDQHTTGDLYAAFNEPNSIRTITRNISNGSRPVNGWQLTGNVSFENNTPNDNNRTNISGKNGSYMDVLDANDKILARLYFYGNANSIMLYANGHVVAQEDNASKYALMARAQNLSITALDGKALSVQYGSYPAITIPVLDSSANLKAPKTLQFYFWAKGQGHHQSIDIKSLKYSIKVNSGE